MTTIGPDFISLQVRDLERSAAFYQELLGLSRAKVSPPHAVVFDTRPIAFAVRDALPGTDLEGVSQLGEGVGIWLLAENAQQLHDALKAADVQIISAPIDGPFGRTFTFADPDGYRVTIHDGE
ncbi:VOC family protein [Psychromicrobium sp. YIM B11713]|uniref:VOC family protein n=1 Tax=Psychromicrobium sp. YIM B11713 TaxID=3145233 RepID=UPI00374E4EF4